MDEPDWKRFKPLRKQAIERFCQGVLSEAADGTAHERYRQLYQLMKKVTRKSCSCSIHTPDHGQRHN